MTLSPGSVTDKGDVKPPANPLSSLVPAPLATGAEVLSQMLNNGAPADHRQWSVGAFTGVTAHGSITSLSLDPEVGLEVARNLSGGLEAFAQGSLDLDSKSPSVLVGLRLRF